MNSGQVANKHDCPSCGATTSGTMWSMHHGCPYCGWTDPETAVMTDGGVVKR